MSGLNEDEFQQLKLTYPDRIAEILARHIRRAKDTIEVEGAKYRGEVPER